MINNNNSKVNDLIDSREYNDVYNWLKNFKKVKTVTRDGSKIYAKAISDALPEAIQISDRFHLFKNLVEYAKDDICKIMPIIIKVEKNNMSKKVKLEKSTKNIDAYTEKRKSNYNKKYETYIKVRKRFKEVNNVSQVAREFGICERTVKRYISIDKLPRNPANNVGSKLDKYRSYIISNIEKKINKLYQELKKLGYDGTYSSVKNYVNKIKKITTK